MSHVPLILVNMFRHMAVSRVPVPVPWSLDTLLVFNVPGMSAKLPSTDFTRPKVNAPLKPEQPNGNSFFRDLHAVNSSRLLLHSSSYASREGVVLTSHPSSDLHVV